MEELEERRHELKRAKNVLSGFATVQPTVQLNELEDRIGREEHLKIGVEDDEGVLPVHAAELGGVGSFSEGVVLINVREGHALQELGGENQVFRVFQRDARLYELVSVGNPGRAEQYLFHGRHASLIKQSDMEDAKLKTFVEEAKRLTSLFRFKGGTLYSDLLDGTEIDASEKELKAYYEEKFQKMKKDNKIIELPEEATLIEEYEAKMIELAIESYHDVGDKYYYVDPMTKTRTQVDHINYKEEIGSNIRFQVKKKAGSKKLSLIPSRDDWDKEWKKIAQVTPSEVSPVVGVAETDKGGFVENAQDMLDKTFDIDNSMNLDEGEENEEDEGNVNEQAEAEVILAQAPNNALPVRDSTNVLAQEARAVINSEEKEKDKDEVPRETFFEMLSPYDKRYYLIKFRDYLRLVRRLTHFYKVHKGLTKELMYVKYVEKGEEEELKFSVNHPFFKPLTRDNSIDIYKYMGLTNIDGQLIHSKLKREAEEEAEENESRRKRRK